VDVSHNFHLGWTGEGGEGQAGGVLVRGNRMQNSHFLLKFKSSIIVQESLPLAPRYHGQNRIVKNLIQI
jgi:hypothetical protein